MVQTKGLWPQASEVCKAMRLRTGPDYTGFPIPGSWAVTLSWDAREVRGQLQV